MIIRKKKRILRSALALFISTVTIASISTPVYSAPSKTKELEKQTSDLQGELNTLNEQLSTLSAELDAASAQVEELSAEVEKSKLDLASAQLNEEAQYDSMKDRIKFMYEGGNTSLLQILFSSEDMGDFLNKAEYVTSISEYDRSMLEELKEVRKNVEEKQKDLEEKQKELASLESDLSAKQEELNSRISSTSAQLADYQEELDRAKAAEEALKTAQNDSISGSLKPSSANDSGSHTNNGSANRPSTPSSTSDVALFAAILQCEAGGYEGMLAVATVIMNRVESPAYPNTLREVIYQPGQFAPTWNGSLKRVLETGASSTAYTVAQDTLAGARHSAVIHCYQFRSASTGVSGINIGGNVFF